MKSNYLMQVGNNYSEFNYRLFNSLTQKERSLEPLKWRHVSEECLDIASGKTQVIYCLQNMVSYKLCVHTGRKEGRRDNMS